MDFRLRLYKFTICLLVSIFLAYMYSLWHISFGLSNFIGPFIFGFLISFIVLYIIISLLEEKW